MTKGLVRALTVLAFAVLIAARVGHAQSVTASAVMMDARHELLEGDLIGALVDVSVAIGRRSAVARFGAERLTGETRHIGVPCSGLLQPGTCPPELLVEDTRFTALSAGLADRLLGWRGVRVDLGANLRVGRIDVETHAQTSGRRRSADRWMWGPELVLDAAWLPWASRPLAVELGVAAGGLKPFIEDGSVDNYAPFRGDFGTTRLRLGLSWRRGVGGR